MSNIWKSTEEVIEKFRNENKERMVSTQDEIPMSINPQRIIGIRNNYTYPEILHDYRMEKLKESYNKNGWINKNIQTFSLIMFPNGDLVVDGGGNHRAVLSKELAVPSVMAMVSKVIYED